MKKCCGANRWLGLPIFAVVMFAIYYLAMVTVGASATDWANDGLFGDGYHLLGIGSKAVTEAADDYTAAVNAIDAFVGFNEEASIDELKAFVPTEREVSYTVEDEETLEESEITVYFESIPAGADEEETNAMSYRDAVAYFEENGFEEPDPVDYGVWVPGVPAIIESGLDAVGCADFQHCGDVECRTGEGGGAVRVRRGERLHGTRRVCA